MLLLLDVDAHPHVGILAAEALAAPAAVQHERGVHAPVLEDMDAGGEGLRAGYADARRGALLRGVVGAVGAVDGGLEVNSSWVRESWGVLARGTAASATWGWQGVFFESLG